MDQSFASVGSTRYPPGDPDDNWTIDEVVRWSLDKHRHIVIEKTESSIALLKDQCERECEDVLTLHTMAVEIERSRRLREKDGGAAPASAIVVNDSSNSCSSKGSNVKYEENEDPQRMSLDVVNHHPVPPPPAATALTFSTSTATTTEVEPDITVSSSSSLSPTITVQITVGPHAPSTYTIHPKPNTPCVIGRSKGKKFTKNGISLYKDQEVSTTHGKFLVVMEEVNEEVLDENDVNNNDNADNNGAVAVAGASSSSSRRMKIVKQQPRYYYIDVGSTNGTIYNGVALVPNVKLELIHGMEIKVGNSLLQMEIL
jgi:hypothetical protein